jgi:hypothetical protein
MHNVLKMKKILRRGIMGFKFEDSWKNSGRAVSGTHPLRRIRQCRFVCSNETMVSNAWHFRPPVLWLCSLRPPMRRLRPFQHSCLDSYRLWPL